MKEFVYFIQIEKEKMLPRLELFDKFSSELEVVEARLGETWENGARNEPTSSEFWLGLYVGRVGGSVRCVGARVGVPAYVWNCAGRRDLGRRQVNTPLNSVPQLHACLRTYIGFRFPCPSQAVRIIDVVFVFLSFPFYRTYFSFFFPHLFIWKYLSLPNFIICTIFFLLGILITFKIFWCKIFLWFG